MNIKNSIAYGDSEIPEPDICTDSYGIMIGSAVPGGKPVHITMPSALPFYKIKGNAAWGGVTNVINTKFIRFYGKNYCDNKMVAIAINPSASDYIPMVHFENC